MDALIGGMPALGILPAPTPEIAESLASTSDDWPVIKDLLDRVVASDPLTDAERIDLYHRLVVKVRKVEEIGCRRHPLHPRCASSTNFRFCVRGESPESGLRSQH